jgi:hypothetical protein
LPERRFGEIGEAKSVNARELVVWDDKWNRLNVSRMIASNWHRPRGFELLDTFDWRSKGNVG